MIGIGEAINVHTKQRESVGLYDCREGWFLQTGYFVVQLEVACSVVDLLMCIKSTGV